LPTDNDANGNRFTKKTKKKRGGGGKEEEKSCVKRRLSGGGGAWIAREGDGMAVVRKRDGKQLFGGENRNHSWGEQVKKEE